jgi:hypothetical protein
MTNARNARQHADNRSNPSNDGPLPHPARRVLVAIRRAYTDTTYLNRRLFDTRGDR